MAYDLSRTLVVGVSATALFDLSEADAVFRTRVNDAPDEAIAAYRAYMLEREEQPLQPGTSYSLVKALLELNKFRAEGPPLVEVVVMSRNSPETGVRVLKMIRHYGLDISRSVFTGGEPVTDYLAAFDVDLFVTTSAEDAQKVIDSAICAAAIVYPPPSAAVSLPHNQVRIAFDGDAVLFSEDSEVVNKREGLAAFHRTENAATAVPMKDGPYASLLRKLAMLQERLPMRVEYSPVRIAVVTARNAPAELRVLMTLRSWNVYVDAVFFLGGVSKEKVLKAFRPHIFFDDQPVHLQDASRVVSAARVPYRTGSALADVSAPKTTMVEDQPHVELVAQLIEPGAPST